MILQCTTLAVALLLSLAVSLRQSAKRREEKEGGTTEAVEEGKKEPVRIDNTRGRGRRGRDARGVASNIHSACAKID